MKFTEYINTHHVFRTDDLLKASDSVASAQEQLRLALKSGKVERVRHGLYASMTGKFQDTVPRSYEIVAAIDEDAPFCYHSALETLGLAHNVSFYEEFYTNKIRSSFDYRGIRYIPYQSKAGILTRKVSTSTLKRINTTTKEQTLCDCLSRPDRSSGIEEVIRSLSVISYLDYDVVLRIAKTLNKTDIARIGWLMSEKADDWRIPKNVLDELRSWIGKGPYLLGHSKSKNMGWSSKWRLILPETTEEIESWIWRNG